MDPLTHILLGANLGYAAAGRRLGRTAALAGGLAAFVPDADVFIRSSTDPLLAIEYHRGFTHALAFAPVGAAVVASLWLFRRAWRVPARWLTLWAACLLAYISHTLLDAATSYGTLLLWPFSRTRFGWDLISIIDPIFTVALAAGLWVALSRRQFRPAVAGLAVAGVYLCLGGWQHARAIAAQTELARTRGHAPVRLEVMPTLANNLVWRALYEHDGRIYSDRVRVGWFSDARVRKGWSLPLVEIGHLSPTEAERNVRRSFQRFAWFSEDWVARSPVDPRVLGDMRYSLTSEAFDPIWGIRFTGAGAPTEIEWVNRSRDRQIRVSELWGEIAGRDARFQPVPRHPTTAQHAPPFSAQP